MNKNASIPLFQLNPQTGGPADFDLLVWGTKDQDYDFEKPHRHNFYEILFFFTGGGTHDIDFATFPVKQGAVHFVAPENVHLLLRGKKTFGCSLVFTRNYFQDEEITATLPFSSSRPVIQLDAKEFAVIRELIKQVQTEYFEKQADFNTVIKGFMLALMAKLRRSYAANVNVPNEKLPANLLSLFLKLLDQHFLEHLSVTQYADLLHMSSKHLIEQVKKQSGKTPLQHIREKMVAEAKRMLFYTGLSVKEVAFKLGFDDPANFSRYFKTVTGYSPLEYREGIR